MAQVTAILNQKGGVGKTTTAINLGACLAAEAKRVLVVDMDPQANCTSGLGVDASEGKTSYDIMSDNVGAAEAIRPTATERLFVVPSTIDLAGAEVELVAAIARESRLREALLPVLPEYDYVLLDTPPSLGLLTVNCLTSAHWVLIPIQCEYYALQGLAQLRRTVQLVERHLNPALRLMGVLLTMFDGRTRLSREVVDHVRSHFAERVFETVIPRSVRLSEAPSYGQPIIAYDPGSKGAEAYTQLAKEVIAIGDQAERPGVPDPGTGEGVA
ncbi:MAG: ParA family protein [Armatimonadota bacterium]|nr:MAG: ParA family protein [Armatimonadota bacterium]